MPASHPYRSHHYWIGDALYLLGRGERMFYMNLSNGGIGRVLTTMKTAARGYQKFIDAYPSVCCEPLDSFYWFRKATGMLDEELLCDLQFCLGWREANWGAWLAALAPQPVYAAHLERRLPTLPHGTTVLQLALGACGQAIPLEHRDMYADLQEVQETLNRLPAQPAPLRLAPTPEQERAWMRERTPIREAFRAGGLEAAKLLMRQGISGYYDMSHNEWLAAGAPEAPIVPHLRKLRHRVPPRF